MNLIEQSIDSYVHEFIGYIVKNSSNMSNVHLHELYQSFKQNPQKSVSPSTTTLKAVSVRCNHVFKRGKQIGETCNVMVKDGYDKCPKHRRTEEQTPKKQTITEEMMKIDLKNIVSEDEENEIDEEELDIPEEEDGDEKELLDEDEEDDVKQKEEEDEELDEELDDDLEDCEVCEDDDWQSEHSNEY